MKRSTVRTRLLALAFAASATAISQTANPPAPDLQSGGPSPAAIPNHDTTEISLFGHNFTGTTVTVSGVCTLASSQVVSDTEIRMKLAGNRTPDDKDGNCSVQVHQGATQAAAVVAVKLTDSEQHQFDARQAAEAKTKADQYMASLGTRWTLRYADGKTETLTIQPSEPGQDPDFISNRGGGAAKIMINGGNKVMIIANDCILSGTITADNKVEDGKVMTGTCPHPGAWTAQKK